MASAGDFCRRRQIVNNGGKQMSPYVLAAIVLPALRPKCWKNIVFINGSFKEPPNSPLQYCCQSPLARAKRCATSKNPASPCHSLSEVDSSGDTSSTLLLRDSKYTFENPTSRIAL